MWLFQNSINCQIKLANIDKLLNVEVYAMFRQAHHHIYLKNYDTCPNYKAHINATQPLKKTILYN